MGASNALKVRNTVESKWHPCRKDLLYRNSKIQEVFSNQMKVYDVSW